MQTGLDAIRHAPSILAAMRQSEVVVARARTTLSSRAGIAAVEAAIDDPTDELTAIAAIHASARLLDERAIDRLVDRLTDPRPFVREHAVWALASSPLWGHDLRAIRGTVDLIRAGGLVGMLAQLTVERLARRPHWRGGWLDELVSAVGRADDPVVRARLVETIGLLGGEDATATLGRIADRGDEPAAVRVAAVAALGERPSDASWDTVRRWAHDDGDLGDIARLAAHDLTGGGRAQDPQGGGMRIAQLYLHAELDPGLTTAGMGETGGIATLLVRLGDALAAGPGIGSVTTISRGSAGRALDTLSRPAGHGFAAVPIGDGVPAGIAHAWPGLVDARRGIARILRAHRPDRLHLRMGDVGSLAGSLAARDAGVPTVFSLAPDPHALIDAQERSGALTRAGFGAADSRDHYWFRVALVQRLLRQADRVVLFPRPDLRGQLLDLVGVDIASDRDRFVVVPEGIDLSAIDAAMDEVATLSPATGWPDVEAILAALPEDRRGLPLVVTVGRMHDVKGMARVVDGWAADTTLSSATNLIVVGGDLDDPSPDEAAELARISGAITGREAAARGLVLAGHRPNATVSRLLVAARCGHPSYATRGGVYVCGSRKEEFGLAIVEALGAGLPVVAPLIGGPATYVDDGDTGFLVDTSDPTAIAGGIVRALATAASADRAGRAHDLVRQRFTIEAMARAMTTVYAGPAAAAEPDQIAAPSPATGAAVA